MSEWKRSHTLMEDIAANSAASGAALVASGHVVAAAVSAGVVAPLVGAGLRRARERQERRAANVLEVAAKATGIPIGELIDRLVNRADTEELLIRTLRAAADATMSEKLVALALSLSEAAQAVDEFEVAAEEAFVRALGDCDSSHLRLLLAFRAEQVDANDVGEGSSKEVAGLTEEELAAARPELREILSPLLAVLQRQGLASPPQMTTSAVEEEGLIELGEGTWRLTNFGDLFVSRLQEVTGWLARQQAEG